MSKYYRLARSNVLSSFEEYYRLPVAYVKGLLDLLDKEEQDSKKAAEDIKTKSNI